MTARPSLTDAQRRVRLARRHLLVPPLRADTVEAVADAVVALHSSDPATVYLSAGARLARPGAAEVDRALYEDVTLVRLLAMRRTLFAVTEDFAPHVSAGAARPVAARERVTLLKHLREHAEGWDEARLARTQERVLAALARHGEATTAELAQDVPELRETMLMSQGKPYEARQSVGSRLLRLLASDGHVRRARPRGSWTSNVHPWAPVPQWPEVPAARARAEIVRRWLASYGPGTEADVKWWTGWTLRDTRAALADLGAVETGAGYVLPGDEEPDAEVEPWAALLPALDPTAMGWRGRDWYLDPDHVPALYDRAGNVGPTVWWNGRIVGAWAQRPDGTIAWRTLTDPGREAQHAVEAEAARLTAWLDGKRITPRFRTPLERELAT
ncbi:winged helix DNA-binding domain-containing protein [Streptantibioticus parmotrematis]|uniref:winged helix DNA-binding domain-containing protein n=1 Tax=Streptantibioticus parmotrematis TaxID=2873249 RepID=UPI003407A15A